MNAFFERRTLTGSRLFELFGRDFGQILRQIVSLPVDVLSPKRSLANVLCKLQVYFCSVTLIIALIKITVKEQDVQKRQNFLVSWYHVCRLSGLEHPPLY